MKKIEWKKLFSSLVITFAIGFLGGTITSSEIPNWYNQLNIP